MELEAMSATAQLIGMAIAVTVASLVMYFVLSYGQETVDKWKSCVEWSGDDDISASITNGNVSKALTQSYLDAYCWRNPEVMAEVPAD